MKVKTYFVVPLLSSLCLFACQSTPNLEPPAPSTDITIPKILLTDTETVPTSTQIFDLSESQKEHFLDYFNHKKHESLPKHNRLWNYINTQVSNFTYHGNTLMASEINPKNTGNCLSLAIYTTALANLVGIDVSYQEVNSGSVYRQYTDIVTVATHIRTILHRKRGELVDRQNRKKYRSQNYSNIAYGDSLIVDYFPSKKSETNKLVNKEEFIAKYYQNRAADHLAQKQFALAFAKLEKALSISPHNAEIINILAVAYRQSGDAKAAEETYRYAIENGTTSLNLLSNYHAFLISKGRLAEAKAFETTVLAYESNNPFSWIALGDRALELGDAKRANDFYAKAESLAPYLHEVYFAKAKSFYAQGQYDKAEEALNQAIANSHYKARERLYLAKLQALKNH